MALANSIHSRCYWRVARRASGTELKRFRGVDPVHVNDFHATLLHLFGLNHLQLTYRFKGLDFRLTDQAGKVVTKLL